MIISIRIFHTQKTNFKQGKKRKIENKISLEFAFPVLRVKPHSFAKLIYFSENLENPFNAFV
jgi:hypothetical protein